MIDWYKNQPITIKGAIIGGLFAIFAAIITILPDVFTHRVTETSVPTMAVPTQKNDLSGSSTSQYPSATPNVNLPDDPTNTPSASFLPIVPTPTNVLYYDDFSNPTSGWNQYSYVNGWYEISFDSGYESGYDAWEKIGTIDGTFALRVTVMGPFEKGGNASRGVIFGSFDGSNREPFSFSIDSDGNCKIYWYSTETDYGGWHKMIDGKVENFDSQKSFYILDLFISNYRQAVGVVDGKVCINAALEHYVPGYVGIYASPTYVGADYEGGKSFFDDFYVYRP